LGLAALTERFGAMHLQVYSTTNHIIWHWLNGITGLLWLGLMLALVPWIGLYAYPTGMLIAYIVFYSRVSMRRSHASLGISFWTFECHGLLPAAGGYTLAAGMLLWFGHWHG
jgi:hypothetical protein